MCEGRQSTALGSCVLRLVVCSLCVVCVSLIPIGLNAETTESKEYELLLIIRVRSSDIT